MIDLADVGLSDDDLAVRALARTIAADEVAPRARDVDENEAFPVEALQALARAGLLGLLIPAEYGGGSATILQYVLATEAVAAACASTATAFITQTHAMLPIRAAGTGEQKERWLPRMASGELLGAIAITEPEAGSDLAAMTTRAERDGDGWRLSGRKMFITNGGVADVVSVFARTGDARYDGISIFTVPASKPGVAAGQPLQKMGIRGSNTAELAFDDVQLSDDALLGAQGTGFRTAMNVLSDARLSTAAQAVGIAQRAYDIAYGYTRDRRQFGQPVQDFQAVQLRLMDMYMTVNAARSLLYATARLVDASRPGERAVEASAAKVYCSDVAMNVASWAVQLMGGYGYMREFEAERCLRDAKITQIYDGTNDLNRLVMARQLAKRLRSPATVVSA